MRRLALLAALVAVAAAALGLNGPVCPAARAQYTPGYSPGPTYNPNYNTRQQIVELAKVRERDEALRGGGGKGKKGKTARPAPAKPGPTTFTPAYERSARMRYFAARDISAYWKPVGGGDVLDVYRERQQATDDLTAVYVCHMNAFDAAARAMGKSPQDVAVGIAHAIALNFETATGKTLTVKQKSALLAGVRHSLQFDQAFQRLNDEERSDFMEAPILDARTAREARDPKRARVNLAALFGAPFERLKITDKGIVVANATP